MASSFSVYPFVVEVSAEGAGVLLVINPDVLIALTKKIVQLKWSDMKS